MDHSHLFILLFIYFIIKYFRNKTGIVGIFRVRIRIGVGLGHGREVKGIGRVRNGL